MKYMKKRKGKATGKGIYILPNLLTTISLLSGFYAIISAFDRRFTYAAIAIFVSCLFDMLDGRVARLTHSTSRFGVEYDSLSDVIAFGVAPGVLVYVWALRSYGNFGWLAAFLFVACGAVRLARFNVQVDTIQKKSFLGLPIPAAAAAIAGCILFYTSTWSDGNITDVWLKYRGVLKSIFMPLLIYTLAFLMVSNIRYYSFKDMSYFKGKPFKSTVAAIALIVIILFEPKITLFLATLGYVVSGPIYSLMLKIRKPVPEEATRLKETPIDPDGRL
jgi:CDP-diacylglycerol--serine O-phosphatidyltransferase